MTQCAWDATKGTRYIQGMLQHYKAIKCMQHQLVRSCAVLHIRTVTRWPHVYPHWCDMHFMHQNCCECCCGDTTSWRLTLHCFSKCQNEILKAALAATGLVAVMASEEDDDPVRGPRLPLQITCVQCYGVCVGIDGDHIAYVQRTTQHGTMDHVVGSLCVWTATGERLRQFEGAD